MKVLKGILIQILSNQVVILNQLKHSPLERKAYDDEMIERQRRVSLKIISDNIT